MGAYLALAPTLICLGVFAYYPAIYGLSRAFFNWQPGYQSPYVGSANFSTMLHDPLWWQSAGHVGLLLLWGITLGFLFPLIAAELVITLSGRRAQAVFRGLLILPLAFPLVVQVLVWGFIYDPNVGIANRLLHAVGLGTLAHNWLGDPNTALYALIFMGFPWIASLPFLIILGALQAVPREVYEAAAVDGAGRFRRLLLIDLPLLRPQFILLLVLAIIQVLQFGIPAAILTQGGPAFATTFPVTYMLNTAFNSGLWGYAAALSSTLFLIILALSAGVAWATLRPSSTQAGRARRIASRLGRALGQTSSAKGRLVGRIPAPGSRRDVSMTAGSASVADGTAAGDPNATPDHGEHGLGFVALRPSRTGNRAGARSSRRRSLRWGRRRATFSAGTAMAVFAFIGLFPFVFMLIASFKNNAQLYRSYWVPTFPLHLDNYSVAWSQTKGYLLSTLIVAGATVLGVILLSSISAYVFARHRFVGRNTMFALIAILLMVPQVATIIPLFVLMHDLGFLNTYWVLILPYIANGVVLGTVLMRGFIQQLPDGLFDAARVDGASEWRIYSHIVMPLILPIIGTVAILTAGNVWDDYFWPSLTITSDNLRTLPVGLAFFSGRNVTEWGPLFAGYTIASVPLVALFLASSRYFLAGLQGGVAAAG